MTLSAVSEAHVARYRAAMHAMQSGVAFEVERGSQSTTPKHLRVGINSCLVDQGALAKLLIAKGVFLEEEYFAALADLAEAEVRQYQDRNPGVQFG